ncbi:MAG: hypothetical protein AABY07_07240 [Nanoarchaeota archaeon]
MIGNRTFELHARAKAELDQAKLDLESKHYFKAIENARDSKKLSALTIASIHRSINEEALENRLEKIELDIIKERYYGYYGTNLTIQRIRDLSELRKIISERREILEEKLEELRERKENETVDEDKEEEMNETEIEDEDETEDEENKTIQEGLVKKSYPEFEEIDKGESELEIEAQIGFYATTVRVEIDDKAEIFILETTNKDEVIARIAERYKLTKEQVLASIQFRSLYRM